MSFEFISNIKGCPKKIDKIIFKIGHTPGYGSLPTWCFAEMFYEIDSHQTCILRTVFTIYGFPSFLGVFDYAKRFSATIEQLPVPKDCYEVYICNAFSWGVLNRLVKPQHKDALNNAEKTMKSSLKPWNFYYAEGEQNSMPFFGNWIFNEYWKSKMYYGSSVFDKDIAFSKMFKKEIENRGTLTYVR